jgi:hypothetical protein
MFQQGDHIMKVLQNSLLAVGMLAGTFSCGVSSEKAEAPPAVDETADTLSEVSAASPACGPVCFSGTYTTGSADHPFGFGSTVSCADAEAIFRSYIITETRLECQNMSFSGSCNVSGSAAKPCVQAGSEYIFFGYWTFSCRDTTC